MNSWDLTFVICGFYHGDSGCLRVRHSSKTETVRFKYGGSGGHAATFNVCLSATCAIIMLFQSISQRIFLVQHVRYLTCYACAWSFFQSCTMSRPLFHRWVPKFVDACLTNFKTSPSRKRCLHPCVNSKRNESRGTQFKCLCIGE